MGEVIALAGMAFFGLILLLINPVMAVGSLIYAFLVVCWNVIVGMLLIRMIEHLADPPEGWNLPVAGSSGRSALIIKSLLISVVVAVVMGGPLVACMSYLSGGRTLPFLMSVYNWPLGVTPVGPINLGRNYWGMLSALTNFYFVGNLIGMGLLAILGILYGIKTGLVRLFIWLAGAKPNVWRDPELVQTEGFKELCEDMGWDFEKTREEIRTGVPQGPESP